MSFATFPNVLYCVFIIISHLLKRYISTRESAAIFEYPYCETCSE